MMGTKALPTPCTGHMKPSLMNGINGLDIEAWSTSDFALVKPHAQCPLGHSFAEHLALHLQHYIRDIHGACVITKPGWDCIP